MPFRRSTGYAPPGTRVTNVQTDKSQWLTYTIQALVGACIGDVVILCLLIILLAIGWPLLLILLVPAAQITTKLTIKLWNRYTKEQVSAQKVNLLKISYILSFLGSGFFFAKGWWEWLICKDLLLLFLKETINPILIIPYWIYFSLIGLWFFGALKEFGKVTLAGIIAVLLVWTGSQVNYTVSFITLWTRARFIIAVFGVPWILFGLILILAMAKELIAPNLNFILDTIPWEDYKEAGGVFGLIFPKMVEWKEKFDSRVNYDITVSGTLDSAGNKQKKQRRRTLFAPASDSKGMAKFAIALLTGKATFSEKGTLDGSKQGATHFGFTQPEYRELRTIAFEKLKILNKKGNHYSLNEIGIETMENIIIRTPGYNLEEVYLSPTP